MREFDPSFLTADPSSSSQTQDGPNPSSGEPAYDENAEDLASDPFAAYFNSEEDPNIPPKVLITTSPKASKPTYEFCDEIVGIFPGAEFIRRKKGKGFEVGRIAGWAAGRGYKHMVVVNEDMKKPSEYYSPFLQLHFLNSQCRRNHPHSSSKWSYCIFQIDLHRTY